MKILIEKIKRGVYSGSDLELILGSRMNIKRALDENKIQKVCRGYYSTNDIISDDAYYLIIKKYYKDSVLSGHTCLFINRLSDYMDDKIHIDLGPNSPRTENEIIISHRVTNGRNLGVSECIINSKIKMKIYNPERSLFEAVKLEGSFGSFSAKICKNFIKEYPNYDRELLSSYAENFGLRGKAVLDFLSNISEHDM